MGKIRKLIVIAFIISIIAFGIHREIDLRQKCDLYDHSQDCDRDIINCIEKCQDRGYRFYDVEYTYIFKHCRCFIDGDIEIL